MFAGTFTSTFTLAPLGVVSVVFSKVSAKLAEQHMIDKKIEAINANFIKNSLSVFRFKTACVPNRF
jgi:hypothetical protein